MSRFSDSQRKPWTAGAILALVALVALVVGQNTSAQSVDSGAKDPAMTVEHTPVNEAAQSHAKMLSSAFRVSAESVLPTVVTIETRAKPRAARQGARGAPQANPFEGTPFEEFFKNNPQFGQQLEGNEGAAPQPRQGTGSGVIVDPSGIVLTNNHVVDGADEVRVRLHDGREFVATDVKTDPQTDLAVLRIEGAGTLPAAKLGNSDQADIGDWVLAVGNPFGLDSTVSAGIISGKQRELRSGQRTRFLQTDAAINPGNSGGPLVNLDGEVVGINTAIATNSGGYQGVGFAIPSNQAKWVMDQLIRSGTVQRAWLGVSIGMVTKELASQFGVEPGHGVLVAEVHPESPAANAGLREGDVIVSYADTQVRNPRDLQEVVERAPLNTKQKVSLLRDGKSLTLDVVAKPLPTTLVAGSHTPGKQPSRSMNALGMTLSDLGADQAKALGFEGMRGVLITEVEPGGAAAQAGLSEGMLVLKVGKQEVHSLAEFEQATAQQSLKDGLLLLVRGEEGNRFVVLRTPE